MSVRREVELVLRLRKPVHAAADTLYLTGIVHVCEQLLYIWIFGLHGGRDVLDVHGAVSLAQRIDDGRALSSTPYTLSEPFRF